MGNVMLKLVKIGLIGSAIYCEAKVCCSLGYLVGYGDAAGVIFDAAGLPEDDPRRMILATPSMIDEYSKGIKSKIKEIKTILKK